MTDLNQIVNNWSFALFDLARCSNEIIKITNESAKILKVLKENKEYLKMLNSFDIDEEKKYVLIDEAFNSYHPYILNTIKLATKRHLAKYLDLIFHRFIELSNEKMNIKYGIVFTPKKISKEDLNKLEKKMSIDLGSKVKLTNEIDTNLIGGIRIKVDEFLIDNSVLGKLEKIKKLV
ncbi:F0F1 ATP synthase subunit delta [Metamycoplasma phocicerebrale]|uniref:ATP synthase subunit delta n=1 Tax=Metamycoplasma phocicerebrale TaxID=142649 RepID=A0A3T0TU93_9BACT|nr:F0F1 ATP synthase subunit delta [Metamycoplasma phocicerebrale]AZZ65618.1 F0F1 ATP synthase subunit delta [Metamycoplasma phocicerebrale]